MPIDALRRKRMHRMVPEGTLVNRRWLIDHGLTGHAIDNMLKSRQLVTVKNGVYKREGSEVEWGDVVYYLQRVELLDLTIGGITALELQKLAQYLSLSNKRLVHLYGKDPLPSWLDRASTGTSFIKHALGDFLKGPFAPTLQEEIHRFTRKVGWKNTHEGLRVSIPERAILEVLNLVPAKISFEHAEELMQGLNTLSPKILQQLLEFYGNVKVRRLFFYFAEKLNHPWLSRLDKTKIDFGKGNRVVAKDGHLNKQYQITVPVSYE